MPTLTVIERTERIYEVELTEEQYELSKESGEGFDKIYEEMSAKLKLARIKEGARLSPFSCHLFQLSGEVVFDF